MKLTATLKLKGKKTPGLRMNTTINKKEDSTMFELCAKINTKLDTVEEKVDRLEEKLDMKQIEDLKADDKENKQDIKVLVAEMTDLREEFDIKKSYYKY